MKKSPMFSICIPVRNGGEYFRHTLRTCTDQLFFDDFEVVVSDNDSHEDIEKIIKENGSDKIRYVKTPGYIGMGQNFDFALDHAQGEYRMIIGADDGLSRHALYVLNRIIKITGERLVMWNRGEYYWPDHHWMQNTIAMYNMRGQNLIRGADMARRCIRVINGDPPHMYDSAVIHRDLIAETERRTGKRLHESFLADYYEGIMSGLTAGRFIKLGLPLALYAERPGSASAKIINNLTEAYLKEHHSADEIEKMNARSVVRDSFFSRQFYFYLQKYVILCQAIELFPDELQMKKDDISVKRIINLTLADYAYRASLMQNGEEFFMAVNLLWEDVRESGNEELMQWYRERFLDERDDPHFISRIRGYFDGDEKRRFSFSMNCDGFDVHNIYDAVVLWDKINLSKEMIDTCLEDYLYAWKRGKEYAEQIRSAVRPGGTLGVYGAGLSGLRTACLLRYFITDIDFDILFFDQSANKAEKTLSADLMYRVLPPSSIKDIRFDAVTASIYRYDEEIYRFFHRESPGTKIIRLFEPYERNWIAALTDG